MASTTSETSKPTRLASTTRRSTSPLQQPLALAGARGGRIGNYRSDARSRFEEAFLDQMLDHFVGRVGVDLQTGHESANRRECLTCLKLAADKGFHSGVDDLIEDGLSGAKLKPEGSH